MRLLFFRCCLTLLVALPGAAGPAQAQGFFQSLFGGGAQSAGRRYAPAPRGPWHGQHPYYTYNQSVPWWQTDRRDVRRRSTHYKAMCVRMCDGYYWPMTSRATWNKLNGLAHRCEDSCNGDARLFYMPASSTDVARMTDLTGRAYEHIDTAFLYRKKLVKSCSCKPMPWSHAARVRHMNYAAEKAEADRKRMRLSRLNAQSNKTRALAAARPDRTIVESLDDADSGVKPDVAEALPNANAVSESEFELGALESDATDLAWPDATKPRRRLHQAKHYRSGARRRDRRARRKPKYSWSGGTQSKHVWPGDRRRQW